jgi:hypothetical protein
VCAGRTERKYLWKTAANMRVHCQSVTHRDLLQKAQKQVPCKTKLNGANKGLTYGPNQKVSSSSFQQLLLIHGFRYGLLKRHESLEMALYYPTESPDEPVEHGTRVIYGGPAHIIVKDKETGKIHAVDVAVVSAPYESVYCCACCHQLDSTWRLGDECELSFTGVSIIPLLYFLVTHEAETALLYTETF